MSEHCQLCGQAVRIVGGDEGTQHYEPVAEREGYERALKDVERISEQEGKPVGNFGAHSVPGKSLEGRQRAAELLELGSQKLHVLRIVRRLEEQCR